MALFVSMSIRRKNIPCRFYGTFGCKYGNSCRFDHSYYDGSNNQSSHTAESTPVICPFFLGDCCKFGERCRNLHQNTDTSSDAMKEVTAKKSSLEGNECGICMDPAPNALYGLMSHCDCKFCLNCIRKWRNVAKSADQVRLCPLCRVASSCVIPSKEYLEGELKRELVEAFKSNAANIPCKVGLFREV